MYVARLGRLLSGATAAWQAVRDAHYATTADPDIIMAFTACADFVTLDNMPDSLHYNQTGYTPWVPGWSPSSMEPWTPNTQPSRRASCPPWRAWLPADRERRLAARAHRHPRRRRLAECLVGRRARDLALALVDGAGVATWSDEVSTADAAQGTSGSQPAQRSCPTGLNGHPGV